MSDKDARNELQKDIFAAIRQQMSRQPDVWSIVRGGHKALLMCNAGCCRISVGGTVQNPGRTAPGHRTQDVPSSTAR
jgi:hypothetical protein